MTFTNAQRRSSTQRALPLRAGTCGLFVGLLAALGPVSAAPAPGVPVASFAQAATVAADPAKQVPAEVAVAAIDFKRGDGGAGKLVLRFDGEGAAPDLRTEGGTVIVNVGNASLPAALQKPLNVTDFATPVQRIDANQGSKGTQIVLSTQGAFEPLAYQTGRDYIVEIVPRAAAPSRAVGAAAANTVAATGQTAVQAAAQGDTRAYRGRPVTFNFQDVPVRTVLQLIAELSDLNIVASDSVTGNVTLRLINVPWDQALDIVLQAKSLDKRRSGNVVWVAPQAEIAKFEQDIANARIALEESAEMITEYIPISYGSAEDISKLLTDESKSSQGGGGGQGAQSRGFLSARGSLSHDRRTNTLLVIDIPQRVEEIKRLVATLDKPVDQVVIESRIVIANESFARDLGARFGIRGVKDRLVTSGSLDSNNQLINSSIAAINDPNTTPTWGPYDQGLNNDFNINDLNPASIAFTILGNTIDWDLELQALQQEQRGEVVSNPRVVTSNQREAIIRQGREVGYMTVTGGQSNSVPTVQFKEALLELKVTPTITADGRVFLNLAVKKDEIQDYTTITGYGSVPNLAKREVTTAVLIEDGQTVVIGGVYEFEDRNSVSKVPFLGDLPILGNLFKTKSRSKAKAELLIFVTPRVLRVAPRSY
ncbi:type IV pilus secretin PilQ [Luteimonas sp. MC1750]|uniref:type IV pilus secretin PilQ n=1 Tax=Luteimonas sp. MC1750 TaxID=2799326 RepID=UPI0018F0F7B7|nr:type IV pilus secretin PilQ [Luteimonas sp. MC1750]MBJ6983219.1 type IV pilus secretin PilQ [Luteimonas sp. MC1750]QQO05515.1 type IV pilus secretin PilQ [Luteimonas sp. MC1750]